MNAETNHSWMSNSQYGGKEPDSPPKSPIQYGEAGQNMQGDLSSDDEIKERAMKALAENPLVDDSNIEIDVVEGFVLLHGKVPEKRMRQIAEECVRTLDGVERIENKIF